MKSNYKVLLACLFLGNIFAADFAKVGFSSTSNKPAKKFKFVNSKKNTINLKNKPPGKRFNRKTRSLYVKTNVLNGIELTFTDPINGGYLVSADGTDFIAMELDFEGVPIQSGVSFDVTNGPDDGAVPLGGLHFRTEKTSTVQTPGAYQVTYNVTVTAK